MDLLPAEEKVRPSPILGVLLELHLVLIRPAGEVQVAARAIRVHVDPDAAIQPVADGLADLLREAEGVGVPAVVGEVQSLAVAVVAIARRFDYALLVAEIRGVVMELLPGVVPARTEGALDAPVGCGVIDLVVDELVIVRGLVDRGRIGDEVIEGLHGRVLEGPEPRLRDELGGQAVGVPAGGAAVEDHHAVLAPVEAVPGDLEGEAEVLEVVPVRVVAAVRPPRPGADDPAPAAEVHARRNGNLS